MHIITTLSEPLIYLVAFFIIISETGLLFFFFLPGDTLLFSLGILARSGVISLGLLILILIISAILGNLLGYYLGSFVRNKRQTSYALKKIPEKYVIKTESFYEKYGVWTVLISRFIPIVRTIAPFLAGVSRMQYKKYVSFSVIGSILWISAITLIGFTFGKYVSVAFGAYIGVALMITASILTPIAVYISKRYLKRS